MGKGAVLIKRRANGNASILMVGSTERPDSGVQDQQLPLYGGGEGVTMKRFPACLHHTTDAKDALPTHTVLLPGPNRCASS